MTKQKKVKCPRAWGKYGYVERVRESLSVIPNPHRCERWDKPVRIVPESEYRRLRKIEKQLEAATQIINRQSEKIVELLERLKK